jgi:outer membrane protein assembly factor BamD
MLFIEALMNKILIYPVLILLGVFYIISCSSTQVASDTPEYFFQEAEEAFKDGKYITALEKYREVKNKFPYSQKAVEAELRIADTLFEQESYYEAAVTYETFKELHPGYAKNDYVQYRIALSYFKQVPDNSAQDLSAAYKAIDSFNILIAKYPTSEHVAKAKNDLRELKLRLAEHENYVANFYYQKEHFLSASGRYEALLKEFPEMGFDELALYRLGNCYLNTYLYGNAKDALERLLKRYPNSEYKVSAQQLIKEAQKKLN